MKKPWNIFICIIIYFGSSEEITVEDNEVIYTNVKETFNAKSNGTFFDELDKTSENLTTSEYEIFHFNNTHVEVRNTFERKKDF